MSGPVGSSTWFGEPGYNLNQSLRFEDGSSTSLTLTPGTAGNRRTFTFSAWFKRGNVNSSGTRGMLFSAYSDANNYTYIGFDDGGGGYDRLRFYSLTSSSVVIDFESTQQLRDVSAWYHVVVAVDTTQGTSGNRVKIYVNGEQVTAWATSTEPSEDYDTFVSSTVLHSIGSFNNASSYYDGYLAEVNLIDGLQLDSTYFGETGAFGEWVPIEYAGAYGDEGFYLTGAGGGLISATGGTITTDGDYKVHSFTSNGTFTPSADGFVEYLVIAGGGGGASNGGGGGAGGYRTGYLPVTSSTAYSITVGTGGALGSDADGGVNGTNSVFSSITSTGGGGGGTDLNDSANDGGSGGGEGREEGPPPGEASPVGQGNDGGNGVAYACGGGGGAGAVGGNGEAGAGTTRTGGVGGAGLASSITGSAVTRAAGGGGGAYEGSGGAGGSSGVGGRGGGDTNGATDAPTANTGSGGGGGAIAGSYTAGTAGATGIVILRYKFQ